MDFPTVIWFASLALSTGLLGWWYLRSSSAIAKRVAITAIVFATAFHLLFAHNKLWVGYQSLKAEYTYQPNTELPTDDLLLIGFRDVAGNALLLDDEQLDVDALVAQVATNLSERLEDGYQLPILPEQASVTPDMFAVSVPLSEPISLQRVTDGRGSARQALDEFVNGGTYRRSNPPRGLVSLRLGIDLRGGVEFLCRLYDRQGVAVPATDEEVGILRGRLDNRGLTEPQISRLSNGDIQVVIPGGTEADAAMTRNLIENTGNLEVREVKASIEVMGNGSVRFRTRGAQPDLDRQVFEANQVLRADELGYYRFAPGYPGPARALGQDELVPEKTAFGVEPRVFYHVGAAELTGDDVDTAFPTLQDGQQAVGITFSAVGGPKNQAFTQRVFNDGPRGTPEGQVQRGTGDIAFLVDGRVASAPRIISPSGRNTVISGTFTREEITNLSTNLKSGALTVKPRVQSERVVGASLGQATITKGTYSMLAALAVVVLLMIACYRHRIGPVAVISLASCISLIFLVLGVFDATLTLPGLAGLVLTVGMAVDANILIFERLREELREDVDLLTCIDKAYSRALVTILDANLTTFIAAMILYVIGTGPVQGFGLTLMIGIGTSMFSALYVGRWLTELFLRDRATAKVPRIVGEVRLPYLKMRGGAFVISLILAVGGMSMFFSGDTDRHFDIDFTGGNMAQVTLDEAMTNEQVLALLGTAHQADPEALDMIDPKAIQLQPYFKDFGAGGSASRQWSFRARDPQAREIEGRKSAIERELIDARRELDRLVRMEAPSSEKATINQTISGIEARVADVDEELDARQDEFRRQLSAAFGDHLAAEGSQLLGAAWNGADLTVELALLAPPDDLGMREVQDELTGHAELISVDVAAGTGDRPSVRIAARFTEAPAAVADGFLPGDAVGARLGALFADEDVSQALVAGQASVAYRFLEDAVEALATENLDVDRPFPSTQHFSAQVGDQMRNAAMIALAVALVAILLYVAARFEFVYGIGAIIALAHDVIITVGLLAVVGLRIDLTVIAALLTIIGYSLNDTIVVFDRIREVLRTTSLGLRQAIDLAIAQTMSRTLLTSATTLAVVTIAFFFGGDGIHAFSGTLLIGLLLGTYSSVFVAAPILVLLARGKDTLPSGPEASDDDDEAGDDEPEALPAPERTPEGAPA